MKVDMKTGIARTSSIVKMASPFIEKKAAASIADYLNQHRETRFAIENPDSVVIEAECPADSPTEKPLFPIFSAVFLGIALGVAIGAILAQMGKPE